MFVKSKFVVNNFNLFLKISKKFSSIKPPKISSFELTTLCLNAICWCFISNILKHYNTFFPFFISFCRFYCVLVFCSSNKINTALLYFYSFFCFFPQPLPFLCVELLIICFISYFLCFVCCFLMLMVFMFRRAWGFFRIILMMVLWINEPSGCSVWIRCCGLMMRHFFYKQSSVLVFLIKNSLMFEWLLSSGKQHEVMVEISIIAVQRLQSVILFVSNYFITNLTSINLLLLIDDLFS